MAEECSVESGKWVIPESRQSQFQSIDSNIHCSYCIFQIHLDDIDFEDR